MNKDRTGDFLSVIEEHKGILYKVANTYCRNIEDRKDLIQEIIIQLWKSFDDYNDKFKYSTWVYRISLNVAISFYRKENSRQRISHLLTTDIFDFTTTDEELNTVEEKKSNLSLLNQIISELKDLDKALILLYLEEKNYNEISEIIGITETNVATKLSRIKNKLKKKYAQLKNH
jgi:RNA polymerase sigma-70 factor (ECF subfamily)